MSLLLIVSNRCLLPFSYSDTKNLCQVSWVLQAYLKFSRRACKNLAKLDVGKGLSFELKMFVFCFLNPKNKNLGFGAEKSSLSDV